MKRMITWGIAGLIAIFLLIQLIPVNRTNPPVTREIRWDSPQTRALAQRACFDCHSNETIWPWYSNVAPVKFLLANHVREGRQNLNFSEWDRPNEDYEEVEENIVKGYMPLGNYLMMHPEARLTEQEKKQLLDGFKATFDQDPPIESRRP